MSMLEDPQARLQQYAEQQQLLLEITQQIADGASAGDVLPHIVEGIARVFSARCVRLVVATSDARSHAFGAGPLAEHGATLDERLLYLVAEHGAFEVAPGGDAPFDVSFVPPEFVSLVVLPLETRDALHGALWLAFGFRRVLGEAEHKLLAILAGQAAIAIANARSFAVARQRHEWLAAVLAHTPDPVLVVDRELRLQLANPAAQAIFPALDRDAIDQPLDAIADVRDLAVLFDADEVPHADGETPPEFMLGDERIYIPSISEVITDDDAPAGWVLVLQDVTRFKRLHDNMSDFLSTVSHDMRTPLTFMKGYLDMLGMIGTLNDKQSAFVDKIRTGFLQIADMVEKILKAGRLDPVTGTYRLEREPCDLVAVLDEVYSNLKGPAQEKDQELRLSASDDIPVLNVDRDLIASALMNLAENAVKYTPEGGHITLELSLQDGSVVFRVADDGLGISEADQHKLFRRNVRIHRKEWKRVKGSGLGLFIVKNVAQRHGGDAWVESAEGEGSTFYFSIPLAGLNLVGGENREEMAVQAE